MGCGFPSRPGLPPENIERAVSERAPGSTVKLCGSCISVTHSSIAAGAIFYFAADPTPDESICSLCAVVRGSYLEHLKTNLYWIHHPPKTKRQETTSRHLIKLEVKDVTSESLDEYQCDLAIAKTTLQDTWYDDEVEQQFYFHSNHTKGACGLERQTYGDPVSDYTEYGALSAWADLELARAWIRECNSHHANCEPIVPVTSAELHPSTRFIDVKSRRLVHLNETTEMPVDFIALSYVWGSDYQLRTTSATVSRYRERLPASTDNDGYDRVPKTIEDAMEVTLALGYRYLWVDALCIIQDSPADLDIQLAQMDHIYGLAVLTIVSRSGGSSDSGIPGVSIPRDWLGGENLACTLNHGLQVGPWDNLDPQYEKDEEKYGVLAHKSCYMWRGWTFQEQILSTRALEFNRRRLVFWCGRSEPAVECGSAPMTDMRDAHHFRSAVTKYKETGGVVPPGEQAWNSMTRGMLVSRWNTIREHFSTRHFTFPSDRRNAVLGTASMLRHIIGDIDSSGHVLSQLGTELLWYKTLQPGWDAGDTPAIELSYNPAPSGMYPSWSWLSLWPLCWPSNYEPFPGVDLQLRGAGADSVLEIRGPSLKMSVVGGGAEDKGRAVAYYRDGTDSELDVCLDRPLEARTAVTCAPIASTIYSGRRMYAWCYGLLLLRDIGSERFERAGVAFAVKKLDLAKRFVQRINSDQACHFTIVCV